MGESQVAQVSVPAPKEVYHHTAGEWEGREVLRVKLSVSELERERERGMCVCYCSF